MPVELYRRCRHDDRWDDHKSQNEIRKSEQQRSTTLIKRRQQGEGNTHTTAIGISKQQEKINQEIILTTVSKGAAGCRILNIKLFYLY